MTTKNRKNKAIKAWMPRGVNRLIVLKTPAPVAHGRMEVFKTRKHGRKFWGDGLVRVKIMALK